MTCLRDSNDLAIVTPACLLEVLRQLCRFATSGLADEDGDRIGLDGVEKSFTVASYREKS